MATVLESTSKLNLYKAIDHLHAVIPDNSGSPDIWEDCTFAEAPYTADAARHKKAPYLGSTQLNDQELLLSFLKGLL